MSVQYATKESFDVYVTYLAMKRHFTNDSYDFHKYNGKIKASYDKFQTRNDTFFFYKLSKNKDYVNLMLANMLKNPSIWIRDLCDDAANDVYLDWKKKINSLTYLFTSDLNNIDDDYKTNFLVKDGQHPVLVTKFLQRKITLETFAILVHVSNTAEYWEKNITDKIVAKDAIIRAQKYVNFIDLDTKKFKKIVKDHFFAV